MKLKPFPIVFVGLLSVGLIVGAVQWVSESSETSERREKIAEEKEADARYEAIKAEGNKRYEEGLKRSQDRAEDLEQRIKEIRSK